MVSILQGLWSDSLVVDMLWFRTEDYRMESYCGEPLRAPSWSWASGKGSIGYEIGERIPYFVEADVIGFACELNGVSATGKVKSGWVRLKSSIIVCGRGIDGRLSFTCSNRHVALDEAHINFKFDEGIEPSQFLMVRMATSSSCLGYRGTEEMLLVQDMGDEGEHFRRVGYANR
jgi:hypothetical protein